jgi:hypothetical protein
MPNAASDQPDFRYVAHFDMLGMSELTQRDPDLAWRVLSQLTQAKHEILALRIGLRATGQVISDRVYALTFSDTILLFSLSDQPEDTQAMVVISGELFMRALHYSIPLRGGIAHGRFIFNLDENLFAGPPLVTAYHLSDSSQWLGIRLDATTASRARAIPVHSRRGNSAIIDWPVPLKDGTADPGPVIDWAETHRHAFTGQVPLSTAQFYQAFVQLFGPLQDLPESARRKWENTTLYANQRLQAS